MHNIFYYKNISNSKLFLFFYCEENSLVFFHKEEELCILVDIVKVKTGLKLCSDLCKCRLGVNILVTCYAIIAWNVIHQIELY